MKASVAKALSVMARIAAPVRQLVVVGEALADVARHWRGPGVAIAVTPAQGLAWAEAGFELFLGRNAEAAYWCEHFVCRLPLTDRDALLAVVRSQGAEASGI